MCSHWLSPDTSAQEIEETFKSFLRRDDIAIILINQNVRLLFLLSLLDSKILSYINETLQKYTN